MWCTTFGIWVVRGIWYCLTVLCRILVARAGSLGAGRGFTCPPSGYPEWNTLAQGPTTWLWRLLFWLFDEIIWFTSYSWALLNTKSGIAWALPDMFRHPADCQLFPKRECFRMLVARQNFTLLRATFLLIFVFYKVIHNIWLYLIFQH